MTRAKMVKGYMVKINNYEAKAEGFDYELRHLLTKSIITKHRKGDAFILGDNVVIMNSTISERNDGFLEVTIKEERQC